MFRRVIFSAALALGAAPPAGAEEASVHEPIVAVSLHEGPLDMVAYYTETGAGAFEVVATFRSRQDEAPERVDMALEDGDDVHFSMPGYPQALYGFSRIGTRLGVSVDTVCSLASAPCI